MDSIDAFNRSDSLKIKAYLKILVDHIEKSESINDLFSIEYSDFNIYGPLKKIQESNPDLNLISPENPPSPAVKFNIPRGKLTEQSFPLKDLFVFSFDKFKLFVCLRGTVCTFLCIGILSVNFM